VIKAAADHELQQLIAKYPGICFYWPQVAERLQMMAHREGDQIPGLDLPGARCWEFQAIEARGVPAMAVVYRVLGATVTVYGICVL
jgi:hypothetical protein